MGSIGVQVILGILLSVRVCNGLCDCNPMRLVTLTVECVTSVKDHSLFPPPLFGRRRNRKIGSDLPVNKLIAMT